MPVVVVSGDEASTMKPAAFVNENELQQLLANNPSLLSEDHEPGVAYVAQELIVADAGRVDLLLVTDDGRPTVVEVKLERNGESRREVVAQAFDYVSALAQYTVRELNRMVSGKLEEAMRSFAESDDDGALDRRWDTCGDALRAGGVRVVVAIDKAPPDLVRIVHFINEHSDLDVRLVEVGKYQDDGRTILVPKMLVYGGGRDEPKRRTRREPASAFLDVVAAWDGMEHGHQKTAGRAATYRFVHIEGWPSGLHYEFVHTGQQLGAELHLEADSVRNLQEVLEPMATSLRGELPGILWDPKWSRRRGRLMVRFPVEADPQSVVAAMLNLVTRSRPVVDAALAAQQGSG